MITASPSLRQFQLSGLVLKGWTSDALCRHGPKATLAGIQTPLYGSPDDDTLYFQRYGDDVRVTGFAHYPLRARLVSPVPMTAPNIGDPALFGFTPDFPGPTLVDPWFDVAEYVCRDFQPKVDDFIAQNPREAFHLATFMSKTVQSAIGFSSNDGMFDHAHHVGTLQFWDDVRQELLAEHPSWAPPPPRVSGSDFHIGMNN